MLEQKYQLYPSLTVGRYRVADIETRYWPDGPVIDSG